MDKDTRDYQLLQEEDIDTANAYHVHSVSHGRSSWSRLYFVLIHLVLSVLAAVVFLGPKKPLGWHRNYGPGASWSPIRDHVEFKVSGDNAVGEHHSIYSGQPNAAGDQAWDKLIKPSFFRATREELERAGETVDNAAEIADGDGHYLGAISVYHDLHCLRRLRFYLYRTHYYPNLTQFQEEYLHEHLDHCIEMLRRTIMCYGSPSMLTFTWNKARSDVKPAAKSNAKAVCVDWESVERWGRTRQSTNYIPVRGPSGGEEHKMKEDGGHKKGY